MSLVTAVCFRKKTIPKNHWAIIFSCISMLVLGLADNSRGPLFPELLKHFNLTNAQGSLSFAFASGSAFFGNMLGAWSLSWSLKKISLDRLLGIAIFFMTGGLLLMGLATLFSFYLLGAIIFGFSMGLTGVTHNLLIAENIEPQQQAKAFSGLHGIYGLSSLIAPLLASRAPIWFTEHYSPASYLTGWQSSFILTSGLALIILFLIIWISPQPKFSNPVLHDESIHGKKSSVKTMLWFGGFFACYVGAELLISTRLALYMRTYFNMNLEKSSDYVTYFFVFLFLGRLFFTFKTFALHLKTQLNLSLVLSLLSLMLGLWLHPFFLPIMGLTIAPFYPLAMAYISEITGLQKRRFLTFIMGSQSICVVAMHMGVGYLTDIYGLFYAFGMGVVLLMGSIICLNCHPKISV